MKFPWWQKKQKGKRRGTYKTAEGRAHEQAARTDAFLNKVFLKFLKEHPEEAVMLAKRKFAIGDDDNSDDDGKLYTVCDVTDGDALTVLRKAKAIKNLVSEELEQSNGSGNSTLSSIAEIMKTLPEILPAIRQSFQGSGQGQQAVLSAPVIKPEQQTPQASKEELLAGFVDRFIASTPEAAAQELQRYKDVTGDVRQILWNSIDDSMTSDDVVGFFSLIPDKYSFLRPKIEQFMSNSGKEWLNSVLNEVKKMKK